MYIAFPVSCVLLILCEAVPLQIGVVLALLGQEFLLLL